MRIHSTGFMAIAVAACALLSGCATIVTGGKQNVVFDSSPAGAVIEVSGALRGKTPATIQLSRKASVPVHIKKEGYKSVTMNPSMSLEPWFMGNILIGGLIGSSTDAVSGSINKFAPDSYFVTLEPLEAPVPRKLGGVFTDADDTAKTRQFILVSYESLTRNIAEGSGPYLETLYALLKIDEASRASALETLRGLLSRHENIVDFADQTMRQFRAGEDAQPTETEEAAEPSLVNPG